MHLTEHRPHPRVGRVTGQSHVHGFAESLVEDAQHPQESPHGSSHPETETPESTLGSRAEILALQVAG